MLGISNDKLFHNEGKLQKQKHNPYKAVGTSGIFDELIFENTQIYKVLILKGTGSKKLCVTAPRAGAGNHQSTPMLPRHYL